MNLSDAAGIAVNLARLEAENLGSERIDTEHLALGLLKCEDAIALDGADLGVGADEWKLAKGVIAAFVAKLRDNGIDPKKARRALRKIVFESQAGPTAFSGHRTDRCRAAFAAADSLSGASGIGAILPEHLFLATLVQSSSAFDRLFDDIGADREAVVRSFEAELGVAAAMEATGKPWAPSPRNTIVVSSTPILDSFGRDLTDLARKGKLGPIIGRAEEIRSLAQVLGQKNKNNPILVGDPGVGKTCIVEGLAIAVARENAAPQIKNLRIVELGVGALVAGTKYRGDFEERLESIIKEASSDPNIVLFIDEMHTLVGAGATGGGGGPDAGNMLKPVLARGEIKCIGATTTQEYRKYIEKDPALERRFQVLWVAEPTRDEAVEILSGLKARLEQHHRVELAPGVVEKAVDLSIRYLRDFRLPDKAVDLIDQACAQAVMKTLSARKIDTMSPLVVGVGDIDRVVSRRCKVPVAELTDDEGERLLRLEDFLAKRVIGQDSAIREVASLVRSTKAGVRDPRQPQGVFLFLGSTGTGKTELAKALASFISAGEGSLLSFDMSEYQEGHSVAKLLGAPPGYVGYGEEGILSSRVRSNPASVILLDEIEKAHPSVFDLFLQVFDEGRVTDSSGRQVSFTESIIIMTSNLGSSVPEAAPARDGAIGVRMPGQERDSIRKDDDGGEWKDYERNIREAAKRALRPELLNRIQKVIIFYPLGLEAIRGIVRKFLDQLNERLADRGLELLLDGEAVDFLAQKGYSVAYGARNLKRAFDSCVSEPLGDMILRKAALPGSSIAAKVRGGELVLEPVAERGMTQ